MTVPVKLLGFGFWLFFFNCARCQEKMCAAPYIPNADIVRGRKPNYKISSRIEYKCNPGFEPEQPVQITCDYEGQWTEIQQCTEKMCAAPYIPNAYIVRGQKPNYKISSRIEYKCNPGFELVQPVRITCDYKGQWTEIQQCTVPGICGPPPEVKNGDTIDIPKKEYNTGEKVQYICFNKYILDDQPPFSNFFTCEQGQWIGNIKCLKPCTVTVGIMNERGIESAYSDTEKLFAPHNDHLTFKCKSGKLNIDIEPRQQCKDGEMTLPKCV